MEANLIEKQSEYIKNQFKKLKKKQISLALAHFLTPFLKDKKILSFLDEINAQSSISIECFFENILNNQLVNIDFYRDFLDKMQWDIDEMNGAYFDYSEGAMKLLGAMELLMEFMLKGNIKKAENASVQFLEQIDYYIMLVEEDILLLEKAENFLKEEINRQKEILEALQEGSPLLSNQKNDYEHIIAEFYQ